MENILELDQITCRTCLNNVELSNSLYDCVEYETRVELKDILWRLSNVVIDPNENIQPTRICTDCTEKLLDAYDFLIKVEDSEKRLHDYFLEKKIDEHEMIEAIEMQSDGLTIIEDASQGGSGDEYNYEDIVALEMQEVQSGDQVFQTSFEMNSDSNMDATGDLIEVVGVKVELNDKSDMRVECDASADNDMVIKSELPYTTLILEEKYEEHLEEIACDDVSSKVEEEESPGENPIVQTDLTNPPFQCTTCGRIFAKPETLLRHQKSHSVLGTFECNHCSKSFTRKDNLVRHMITHKDNSAGANKKHTYKHGLCPHCGESFPQASLVIHIRRHTGEKPYKCDLCDKGYPRSQDLMIHKRTHTGEKPHLCITCGKAFARPNKLARHIRVHTGERPYKCTQCNKAFAQSNDLNLHMRRHTGEKPYKCGVCGDCFINGTALKNHRKSASHYILEDDEEERRDRYEKIRVTNPHRPCWRTKVPGTGLSGNDGKTINNTMTEQQEEL